MSSILSAILLAASVVADGTLDSLRPQVISDPHRYFAERTRQAVERADSFSPDAMDYPAKYPTIDISPWMNPSSTDEERQEVAYQVLEQAMSAGSFNIIGHNVTGELLDRLENSSSRFFLQSMDFKTQYSTGGKAGYKSNREEAFGRIVFKSDDPLEGQDLREIYSLIYPPDFADNVQGPAYFQGVLGEYIEQLQPVEWALDEILSMALGLAKGVDPPPAYFRDADANSTGFLRVFRYPAMPSENEDAIKFLPHSDFGIYTILYSREKGLEEIRDEKWVAVPINEGELHINLGEMSAMWSNGLFAPSIHKVSGKAAKDRISFAYLLRTGQSFAGEGVDPVCATDEMARFPRTSTAVHYGKYVDAVVNGKSFVN